MLLFIMFLIKREDTKLSNLVGQLGNYGADISTLWGNVQVGNTLLRLEGKGYLNG